MDGFWLNLTCHIYQIQYRVDDANSWSGSVLIMVGYLWCPSGFAMFGGFVEGD